MIQAVLVAFRTMFFQQFLKGFTSIGIMPHQPELLRILPHVASPQNGILPETGAAIHDRHPESPFPAQPDSAQETSIRWSLAGHAEDDKAQGLHLSPSRNPPHVSGLPGKSIQTKNEPALSVRPIVGISVWYSLFCKRDHDSSMAFPADSRLTSSRRHCRDHSLFP